MDDFIRNIPDIIWAIVALFIVALALAILISDARHNP